MPRHVVEGAKLMCSFGTTPSVLGVLPKNRAASTTNAANILDHVPNVNIKPFGMCMSIANPQVASATSAALGVLTPQPCMPCTATPWAPGAPANMLAGAPILNDTSTLQCMWGGVITVTDAGQQTAQVP
jgi:hypothetical protein